MKLLITRFEASATSNRPQTKLTSSLQKQKRQLANRAPPDGRGDGARSLGVLLGPESIGNERTITCSTSEGGPAPGRQVAEGCFIYQGLVGLMFPVSKSSSARDSGVEKPLFLEPQSLMEPSKKREVSTRRRISM